MPTRVMVSMMPTKYGNAPTHTCSPEKMAPTAKAIMSPHVFSNLTMTAAKHTPAEPLVKRFSRSENAKGKSAECLKAGRF